MGMSQDFKIALKEGSTIIRIGTGILVKDINTNIGFVGVGNLGRHAILA